MYIHLKNITTGNVDIFTAVILVHVLSETCKAKPL